MCCCRKDQTCVIRLGHHGTAYWPPSLCFLFSVAEVGRLLFAWSVGFSTPNYHTNMKLTLHVGPGRSGGYPSDREEHVFHFSLPLYLSS
jgi:hypothetical protein